MKQISRSLDWVSLNFSYIGFLIIEVTILAGLIYAYKQFTTILKLYHLDRYQKVKKEMEHFMIVWIIPLVLSIVIRSILIIEATGISSFDDTTRNLFRTLQTLNLGFLYMF